MMKTTTMITSMMRMMVTMVTVMLLLMTHIYDVNIENKEDNDMLNYNMHD